MELGAKLIGLTATELVSHPIHPMGPVPVLNRAMEPS